MYLGFSIDGYSKPLQTSEEDESRRITKLRFETESTKNYLNN